VAVPTVNFYQQAGVYFKVLQELNHILGHKNQPQKTNSNEHVKSSWQVSVGGVVSSSSADVAVATLLLYIPQSSPGNDLMAPLFGTIHERKKERKKGRKRGRKDVLDNLPILKHLDKLYKHWNGRN
jgi:hypothetical protein